MWDILEVTHEGTNDVKRERKHALIKEYEIFRMQKGETNADVQKRFTHIVNHFISLGKIFEREELNIKILKCLDKFWQPKVITISESKDLTTLKTTSLFGKLREHELEMNRLNDQEHEENHVRSIALKTVGHKDCQVSSEDNDRETLNSLTTKFNKFLKKKTTRTNPQIGITTRNSMILMLTIIPVLDVVNRVISKLIAPTLKARREDQTRNLRRREKLKEPTLLGKTMMFLPLAHHQMEMKRQIYA